MKKPEHSIVKLLCERCTKLTYMFFNDFYEEDYCGECYVKMEYLREIYTEVE